MKQLLIEAYNNVEKKTGINPASPGQIKNVLMDDNIFGAYVQELSEGLEKSQKDSFALLAENTRINILENSMMNINPYESLTLPVLRVFYPKFVAKEAITVSPMDKPDCVKAFVRASFAPSNSSTYYNAPVVDQDISGGPGIGTPVAATMPVPSMNFNVLAAMGLTKEQAHLERDYQITGVSADGTAWVEVSLVPAVEGHFSQSIDLDSSTTDVISGMVDYLTGLVSCSSAIGIITQVRYEVTCTLEENRVNPRTEIKIDKIRLYAKDRQIQANWTINMEQDMKSLFDISMQAEIVNLLGQQIATDIDREILNSLLTINRNLNPSSHTLSFPRTPPAEYTWGAKYWHENILVPLNELSAQIYNDTNIDAGNTILCNPLDAAILEDINTFAYTGTSSVNGEVGYREATVAGGKWKILTSSIVTKGTMLMAYKPVDDIRACYFYAPYVPAVLHPFPLGYTPALTILSRYATAVVRSSGFAALRIV
jgi:hypothetical protein